MSGKRCQGKKVSGTISRDNFLGAKREKPKRGQRTFPFETRRAVSVREEMFSDPFSLSPSHKKPRTSPCGVSFCS